MKVKKIRLNNKKLLFATMLIILNLTCMMAQDNAASNINNKINEWGKDVKTVLNAVVGIFSIVGGFLIFIQYMQGNEQAQKNFIRFIIGLAIFGLIAFIANIFLPGASLTNDW